MRFHRSLVIVALSGALVSAGSAATQDKGGPVPAEPGKGEPATDDWGKADAPSTETAGEPAPAFQPAPVPPVIYAPGAAKGQAFVPDRKDTDSLPAPQDFSPTGQPYFTPDDGARSEGDHPLMFHAADFGDGAAIYIWQPRHANGNVREQSWGYDIVLAVLVNGGWRTTLPGFNPGAPRNEDYIAYGRPVYAVSSGEVVRCWRNAPENPTPKTAALDRALGTADRYWILPQRAERYIPGSGNHIVVREADGDEVIYAHGQPGSIPEALCPHNDPLYALPNDESSLANQDAQARIPAGERPYVVAGDFLFRLGNSGESTEPHLHIHKQSPGWPPQPVRMRFTSFMFQALGQQMRATDWIWAQDRHFPMGGAVISFAGG